MKTRDITLEQIEKEFKTAGRALRTGNDGMARVCARRAAGIAISLWLAHNPDKEWGTDTMNKLRHLQMDGSAPADVREAAQRLTTKVGDKFLSPSPTDSISDSKVVIDYFLSRTKKGKS